MPKRLALALAALTAFAGGAVAADLPRRAPPPAPVAPVFTWSGFYLGTYTGGISLAGDIATFGNAPNTVANVAAFRRPPTLSSDSDTALMSGGQIGYTVQFGAMAAGVEADLSYSSTRSRNIFVSALNDPSVYRQDLGWFGTVRGRVGVALDQVFVYATGGLAFADVENRVAFLRNTDLAFQFAGRSQETQFGYTVGGGVEFVLPAFLQRFSLVGNLLGAKAFTVKAEYLYFDLGDRNVLVNAIPGVGLNSYTANFETQGHVARIGFNYRFGT